MEGGVQYAKCVYVILCASANDPLHLQCRSAIVR